ncbi:MAG TPA: thioredoxin domain-containing protein [Terriglobia bacterium]|nr:thioredoxin domain-containing protein [Terriglobia bacterium]
MRKVWLLALSLLGLFDSLYLLWAYTSSSRPLVCIGGGCDVVRASPFAHAWGVPLPVYGVVMYAALALIIFVQPLVAPPLAHSLRLGLTVLAGAGFLTSLYLTSIEGFVLHAWCAWCVVSALAVTLILLLAILEVARPSPPPASGAMAPGGLRVNVTVLGVALAVGTPAFYWLAHHGGPPPLERSTQEALNERLVRPFSHSTGSPDAPVTVVEFGDFQCPVCGAEEPTLRELRQKYGNRIRFVFRQFPLMSLHPLAEKAAEASECAADQGKFWEAVEKLYAEQNDLSLPALMRDAADLGLDQTRFTQCLQSGAMTERVVRDIEDGHALHVDRTPTFFVADQVLAGQIPLDRFSALIDDQLRQQAAAPESAGRTAATAAPPSATKAQEDPGSTGALLPGSPGGAFQQIPTYGSVVCSEDEARKKQPVLVHTDVARQLYADPSKTLFVDVRPPKDFQGARIPKAINIPIEEMSQHWSSLPNNKTIVFYEGGRGAGDICAASRNAGRILLEHGVNPDRVRVYQEGLAAWEKAGLPVTP